MPFETREPFHARKVETLAVSVQREIERQILSGELKAGQRLSESALAESLGLSRGPVREAMRGLKEVGLVDLIPNKGVVIREISVEEAAELYDLRASLFGFVCELLAARRTQEQCDILSEIMEHSTTACAEGNKEKYYDLNITFHASIVDFCGNKRAQKVYQGIVREMHLFRRRGLSIVENMDISNDEHLSICDAIVAGDAKRAYAAGRQHIQNGKERFFATLDEAGDEAEKDTDAEIAQEKETELNTIGL